MELVSPIGNDWVVTAAKPGLIEHPDDLKASTCWVPVAVPGTVCACRNIVDAFPQFAADPDGADWWYRCQFQSARESDRQLLRFHGLATLAEVWLNGKQLLSTDNMFRSYEVEATELLSHQNELVLRFRSLSSELAVKRARPRWKTQLVDHQQLRWIRTTLLGRIPGWTPPAKPIGPWRRIELVHITDWQATDLHLRPGLHKGEPRLRVRGRLSHVGMRAPDASLVLCVDGREFPVEAETHAGELDVDYEIALPDVELWWPHTHGSPHLVSLELKLVSGSRSWLVRGARIGFKSIEIDRPDAAVVFRVNGAEVFMRGVCWVPLDPKSLQASSQDLRGVLEAFRDAGVNMIRVGGTMTYESEAFYELCDELGILVWQDFMFANMDYPADDEAFSRNVEAESRQQVSRLAAHPCMATYCGGSEIEQQAAMMGRPPELWNNALFGEVLPRVCAELHDGIPYFRSSPCDGDLPFQPDVGISHYFGIGAYMRNLSDVGHWRASFASECMGFANPPTAQTAHRGFGSTAPPINSPQWKYGVPRDTGAGWDFEDVRDFYLKQMFGVDPVSMRCQLNERYHELSRIVPGEMITRGFNIWRCPDSRSGGGLVWFSKDLVPGAGWGLLAHDGSPKPVYFQVKRAWQPLGVALIDQGLEGSRVFVFNDKPETFAGTLEVGLISASQHIVDQAELPVIIPGNGIHRISLEGVLRRFYDSSYAYRFGPANHTAVFARLTDHQGASRAVDVSFPAGYLLPPVDGLEVSIVAEIDEFGLLLSMVSNRFLQHVALDIIGCTSDDNYFHVLPGVPVKVRLQGDDESTQKIRGSLKALNMNSALTVRMDSV